MNETIMLAGISAISGITLAIIKGNYAKSMVSLRAELTPTTSHDGLPMLIDHPLFAKIGMLQNKVVLELEMDSQGRQLIAKDVLTNKLDYCMGEYMALAKGHDNRVDTCSGECAACQWVYKSHIEVINNILTKCNTYYKGAAYSTEEKEILDLVWNQFNQFHNERVEVLLADIERTVNSKFYKDCRVQSSIIFDHVSAILGLTVTDAEETFKVINGDLTGRGPFRGVIVDYDTPKFSQLRVDVT